MYWLVAIGAALLWIGVTVQAMVEWKRYRLADPKPSYWYSSLNGWIFVWLGTASTYAAAAQAKGNLWVIILGLIPAEDNDHSVEYTGNPARLRRNRSAARPFSSDTRLSQANLLELLTLTRFL